MIISLKSYLFVTIIVSLAAVTLVTVDNIWTFIK